MTRDLLKLTAILIGAYLILVNYTGFTRSVASVSGAYNSGVKTLQGR